MNQTEYGDVKKINGVRYYMVGWRALNEPLWVPSVTSVLSVVRGTRYRAGKGGKALSAAARGTATHLLAERHLRRKYLGDIHPEVQPYWNSLRPVLDRNVTEVIATEKFVSARQYAGTLDAIVRWHDGQITLVDYKTLSDLGALGKRRLGYQLQLVAYAAAVMSPRIQQCALICPTPGQDAHVELIDQDKMAQLWPRWQRYLERFPECLATRVAEDKQAAQVAVGVNKFAQSFDWS